MKLAFLFICKIVFACATTHVLQFHDPYNSLDQVEHQLLIYIQELYSFSTPLSIVFMPNLTTNDDSSHQMARFSSSIGGLVLEFKGNQVLIQDENASTDELYSEAKMRAEEMLAYSRVEAVRQMVADVYCLSTFQSLDSFAVFLGSSKFIWEPLVNLLLLLLSACLLFSERVIVAVASLPKVGDVDSTKSELVKWLIKQLPASKPFITIFLFCTAAIFYSCIAAILISVALFWFQQLHCYQKNKCQNESKSHIKKGVQGASNAVLLEESVFLSTEAQNGSLKSHRRTTVRRTHRNLKC